MDNKRISDYTLSPYNILLFRTLWFPVLVAVFLMLLGATAMHMGPNGACVLTRDDSPLSHSREGDIILGGVLQISILRAEEVADFLESPKLPACFGPSFRYLRHLLAFIYAIEEINNSTEILPNITLGFQIYDVCNSEVLALQSTLILLSGNQEATPNYICERKPPAVAFIGHLLSSTTYSIAGLTQLYGFPQISYGTLDPTFKDRVHFSRMYSMVPNAYSQFKAIIQLLIRFGWTWVGIIASDEDSSYRASEELGKEMGKEGICVDFLVLISQSPTAIQQSILTAIEVIKGSSASVIIVYCNGVYFLSFLVEADSNVISSKILVSSVTLNIVTDYHFEKHMYAFNGSLLISIHKGDIPGFENYLHHRSIQSIMQDNRFIKLFFQLALGWTDNTTDQSPWRMWRKLITQNEANMYRITYSVYIAVYALAHALHEMYLDKAWLPQVSYGWRAGKNVKLNHYLKNIRYRTTAGEEIFIDEKLDPPEHFDILNWVITSGGIVTFSHVGSFISSAPHQLLINESAIVWGPSFKQTPRSMCSDSCLPGYRKALKDGKHICCFDCIPCSEGEITNRTDMENCLRCPEDQWSNSRRSQCIKRIVDFLSYDEQWGAALASAAIIFLVFTSAVLWVFVKHRSTPIVRANNRNLSYILLVSLMMSFLCSFLFIGRPMEVTCVLRQAAFGSIFAIAISTVLGKTVTVVIAFNATKPGNKLRKLVGSKISISLVLLCSLGELVICITWLICAPPFMDFDTKTIPGTIILQCNEGSIIAFYLAMSYIGILAIFSFIIAFIARKLPDRFNEAQYITFSMLVFCSVWVSFIPAYLSTKGKYVVAVEIFTILTSTVGLLGCIFIPKCYIILIKPETNSKRNLMTFSDDKKL